MSKLAQNGEGGHIMLKCYEVLATVIAYINQN